MSCNPFNCATLSLHKPSISSTFYMRLFHTKVFSTAFSGNKPKTQLCNFWRQNFVQKFCAKNVDEIDTRCRIHKRAHSKLQRLKMEASPALLGSVLTQPTYYKSYYWYFEPMKYSILSPDFISFGFYILFYLKIESVKHKGRWQSVIIRLFRLICKTVT